MCVLELDGFAFCTKSGLIKVSEIGECGVFNTLVKFKVGVAGILKGVWIVFGDGVESGIIGTGNLFKYRFDGVDSL